VYDQFVTQKRNDNRAGIVGRMGKTLNGEGNFIIMAYIKILLQ
jgi:hypothetical protein